MSEELQIVHWPDPRLKRTSEPVREVTPALRDLAARMIELMREHKGVGLAAPQVGHNVRLFIMNHSGEPGDNRVYVNPVLSEPKDEETGEEGCLSLPNVNAQIGRHKTLRIQAQDLDGNPIDETQSGYIARIWQHEYDHLNGVLITDRMGLGDRLKHRKVLKELEEKYAADHPAPPKQPRPAKSQRGSKSR